MTEPCIADFFGLLDDQALRTLAVIAESNGILLILQARALPNGGMLLVPSAVTN
ncbi:MAG: hypothetical protein ACLFUG_13095 [Nitriliruptoraceae bacterium]